VIIGKGGTEVDKLREELKKFTGKDVQINIFEIKRPELDARLVADSIARQLEGRISFRRAMKMAVASTMRMGAEGIKLQVSGRLNGAEIARTGEIPRWPRAAAYPARRHRLRHHRGAHQDGPHRREVLDLPR
jgi:ribosomal protein S3